MFNAMLVILAGFFLLILSLFWLVNVLMAAAKKLRGSTGKILYITLLSSASATLATMLFAIGFARLMAAL